MADNEGDGIVIGLARKARSKDSGGSSDDEAAEDTDMGAGKYDKLLDSAADGILDAVSKDDRDALKEELMDFVKACVAKDKGASSDDGE